MGERSKLTTLCYIEKGDSYLMLHRVSKKHDVNKDKWIGIGGHFEENESPEECLLREAKEETGLTLTSWKFRGIVTFISEGWNTEYMCLYTADGYEGEIIPCNEGVLEWIRKEDLLKLNLWEGDKIFLKLLQENAPFFSLKLAYKGDVLTEAVLDGKKLKKHLEIEFEEKKNTDIYWDDVALFCYPNEYQLSIKEMNEGDILEIDSFDELCSIDETYLNWGK